MMCETVFAAVENASAYVMCRCFFPRFFHLRCNTLQQIPVLRVVYDYFAAVEKAGAYADSLFSFNSFFSLFSSSLQHSAAKAAAACCVRPFLLQLKQWVQT